jgi:hypothetical protein
MFRDTFNATNQRLEDTDLIIQHQAINLRRQLHDEVVRLEAQIEDVLRAFHNTPPVTVINNIYHDKITALGNAAESAGLAAAAVLSFFEAVIGVLLYALKNPVKTFLSVLCLAGLLASIIEASWEAMKSA